MCNFATDMLSRAPATIRSLLFTTILGASAGTVFAQPVNDVFVNATVISGGAGTINGDNIGADTEAGEPDHGAGTLTAEGGPYASIWYRWTAPSDGLFTFDTIGSSIDTILAVYTGNSVSNLTLLINNDDYDPGNSLESRVSFTAIAGTTYRIAIDGVLGEEDDTVLNWSGGAPPPPSTPYLSAGEFVFSVDTDVGSEGYTVSERESSSPFDPAVASTTSQHAMVTVTRQNGHHGRCSVDYEVANILYTNQFYTNMWGTNIVSAVMTQDTANTNLYVINYTNICITNIFATNVYQYLASVVPTAFNTYTLLYGTTISITNVGAIPATNFVTNPTNTLPTNIVGLILTNVPTSITSTVTNYTTLFDIYCANTTPVPPIILPGLTNVTVTNYFCTNYPVVVETVPSAVDQVDYLAATGTLTFDDYQLSAQFPVPIGGSPGPDFPTVVVPRAVQVILSNPQLDLSEDPGVIEEPTIGSRDSVLIHVLDVGVVPSNPFTNGYSIFNIERASFQVSENIGTATIYVLRTGGAADKSVSVDYAIDWPGPSFAYNDGRNNFFPLWPGSDYATPDSDFTLVSGTLKWPAFDFAPRAITIPIINDNIPEFNEDLQVRLTNPESLDVCRVGWVDRATVTILFDDQPVGAVDRNFNRNNSPGSDPVGNPHPGASGSVFALSTQADGKTIIGGNFTGYNGHPILYVARLLANGQFDTNFNAPVGPTQTGIGPNAPVLATAVESNGKVIIGGQFTSVLGNTRNHIARLNPTGTVDESFNTAVGTDGNVRAMLLQPDGKIIIGGEFTLVNGTNRNHIARLETNGFLDLTFNPGSGADDTVWALALEPDGKVVIGGQFTSVNGTNRAAIARLKTDGSLDESFTPGGGADDTVYAVATQSDGKVIIAGNFKTFDLRDRNGITRLNLNGSLDTTFDVGVGVDDIIYSLAVQSDNKILLGGLFTSVNQTRRIGVARLLPDGPVDTTFMDTAYNQFAGLTTPIFNREVAPKSIALALGLHVNGDVMVGGSFVHGGGGGRRDAQLPRNYVCRLVGGTTPGPGNIQFTSTAYGAGEDYGAQFITLERINGTLGPIGTTFSPYELGQGDGNAATNVDFSFDPFIDNGDPLWRSTWGGLSDTRMHSDALSGPNNNTVDIFGNQRTSGRDDVFTEIIEDMLIEGDEALGLTLFSPKDTDIFYLGGENIALGTALGRASASFVINDNDHAPGIISFTASSYPVIEASNAVVTLTRTQGSYGQVSVKILTRDGPPPYPATYGSDYVTNKVNTVTFGDGITNATFTIPLIHDSALEPDESISLSLYEAGGGATNGFITNAIVTIIDDDFDKGHIHFSAPNFDAVESIGAATVTVTRSGGSSGLISVQYATSDGTATDGLDYTGTTNMLSWNDLDTSPRTILIPITDDLLVESNETVNLRLFNAIVGIDTNNANGDNGKVLTNQLTNATITIINDDFYGVPSFVTTNYFVTENAGSALITITRVGGVAGAVSVGYATMDGTATNGFHYGGVTNRLDFAPGEIGKTFTIPIVDNVVTNINRTVNLVLFNPTPSAITNGFPTNATLTIIDDESNNEPAGSLDTIYNPTAGMNDFVHALALQPDGKLVAAGEFTYANQLPYNRIARLNTNGSLDTTFLQNLSGVDSTIRAMVLQTPENGNINGRILIGGAFAHVNGISRKGIARLNSDGSLDNTFDVGAGADNPVYAIAETFNGSNRKVLVAGNFTTIGGTTRRGIARLSENGQVDQTFDPGLGIVNTNGTIFAMAIQANGKIVIGGDFTSFNGTNRNHIARLNQNGTLDMSFNADTGTNGSVRAITIQPDGKILIGGLFTNVNGTAVNHIARLNSNGSLDASFNIGPGANDAVFAITLDANGKILVGGEFTRASGVTRHRLTRLMPDGSVDPSINFGLGANSFVSSIVIQPWDQRILIGGGFTEYDGSPRQHLARIYGGSMSGAGRVSFISAYYGVLETGTNAVIQLRRRGGTKSEDFSNNVAYITFSTSDGTAVSGTDYTGVTTSLPFPDGETFQSVQVPIIDNFIIDGDRTVNLALSNPTFIGVGAQPLATLIITNDDSAISFKTPVSSVSENVPGGNALITVVRTGSSIGTASIEFLTTTNGTAAEILDYFPATNTLVFNSGETNKTFPITIVNDTNIEGDETIVLKLRNPVGSFVTTPDTHILTVVDNDVGPGVVAFAQTNYFVNEGSNAVVTIIRTNGSAGPVAVRVTTSDVTATAGVDYRGTNGFVSFADGEITKDVIIPTFQDSISEGIEVINLTLSEPQGGATIGGTNLATLSILDDDVSFSFSAPAYFVNEGDSTAVITVRRDNGTNGTVQVNYATTNDVPTNGIAVAGIDYTNTFGTLIFAPGETQKTFSVPVIEDLLIEGNETFSVLLSSPVGAQLANPATATVTIIDNETGFRFSNTNYFVDEGGTNLVVTVERINPNTGIASVTFTATDITARAGADYLVTNGILTFADGELSKPLVMTIIEDGNVEGDETVLLTLSNPSTNATILGSNAVVTIYDNDPGIRFSSANYSVSETNVSATITILRTTVTNTAVSIDFVTSNSTATAGLDYQSTNGTIFFAPGETSKTITVTLIDDTVIEGDEDVLLYLSNPLGGAVLINPSVATLTIVDNDGSFIVPAGSALISESGAGTPDGVIDPNENITMLFAFRNKSGGNTTNLVATLLATNGVTAINPASALYGALITNGPSVSRQFSFKAVGTNGQRITATFQLQDGPRDLGVGSFNYVLGKTSIAFSNSAPIIINDSTNPPTKATPYPAPIFVSGFLGSVNKVTASLYGVNHRFPDDIDVLLVGPNGQKTLLMSDCGSTNSLNMVNLTFDDSAASNLPDAGPIPSGTYKPSNFETNDNIPPPAPAGPHGTNLSVFNGQDPNGTWSLYIVDDTTLDSGSVSNGWSLSLATSSPVGSAADMMATMTVSPDPAGISNAITYTITITNYGPSRATDVHSTYTFAPGVTYVTNIDLRTSQVCDANPVITSNTNGVTITLAHGDFPKDTGVAVALVVKPGVVGPLTNVLTVTANEPDPNTNNSTVTLVTPVNVASSDLAVSMVDFPDPVFAGDNVTYVITVTNNGPSLATGVVLSNSLPSGVNFVSAVATPTGSCSNANGVVVCNLGDLSAASREVTIVVQTTTPGEKVNTARVSTTAFDPLKGNNITSVKTDVEAPPVTVARSGSSFILSWSAAASRYKLETTTNLVPPVIWIGVTNPAPALGGGVYSVSVPATNSRTFFRLRGAVP